MTTEEIKKYDDTLADVLCFLKGIELVAAMSKNKKIEQSIEFIDKTNIIKLRRYLGSLTPDQDA